MSACTPPSKQATVRSEQAFAGARYDGAAVAFSEACDLDAHVSDAGVRAKTQRRRAVASAVTQAHDRCGAGLGACLQALATARTLAVHERALGEQVEGLLTQRAPQRALPEAGRAADVRVDDGRRGPSRPA